MSAVELFTYADTQSVRVVRDAEGDPLFVLADLCRVLELSNTSMVAERIEVDALSTTEVIDSMGRAQHARVVSESGMYEVIFMSRKPEAAKFRRWITGEVLPAIRKTGTYSRYPAQPTELPSKRQLAQMVIDAEDRAEAETRARVEAESRAKELAIPASAWSHMADSTGDYAVDDAAKVLSRDPAINIGRGRLFSFMAAEGWIFRDKSTSRWKAYQTQVDTGRLVEKLGSPYLHEPTGEMKLPAPTIRITAKGLAELHKRLGGAEQLPLLA
ncbi:MULTISPECIES: phage antirepressor [Mycobacteroides]|uniref:Gp54 protein n=1 Tax=Mycobacteroides abscessus subsp. abscessus TaxID=1185650 RepID=A0AB38CSR6_9MYCO|nr:MULTISPECIES: phage antirepressor KilAC domain-containing protein [Mycobacteroides]MBV0916083.1 phage antirepressor KilAC domain-containing protein [Mycobacteroides chelonae]MDO3243050.1 BRO family protein [Mycobacteroides abscessus subsp. abscessus]SIA12213.1 gp54 protein [Mycobacteroides abscessus subsp. abscessus]SIA30276.1 gp54 protein [Mycobacteroides abscessus subsp. abscessus]SIA32125.1 gp54 protein [Mycobacteroides abscessus subsp. abscessus]